MVANLKDNMEQVKNISEEQRYLLCDLGFYNDVIKGYLISAMQHAGFDKDATNRALTGLRDSFDKLTAAEAKDVYLRY